jgi:inner membrane protein
MDNLTHSLVGALIGQAGLKRKTGLAMPALIIGANLPDVDATCFFWLDGVQHLGFRRGITHGPIAWVLLPLVLAGMLYGFDRWQAQSRFFGRGRRPKARAPVSFGWLYALAFLACLTHPALDWLNVYGIRLLEPFSSRWFYGDTLFIIDVWLWGLLGIATWLSLWREKRGGDWRRVAHWALTVASVYVFANGLISRTAQDAVEKELQGGEVIASPVPLAFWEREVLLGRPGYWLEAEYGPTRGLGPWRPVARFCALPAASEILADRRAQLDPFLFWSRAPLATLAADGSVLVRDARFMVEGPGGDRFTVPLPGTQCLEPGAFPPVEPE